MRVFLIRIITTVIIGLTISCGDSTKYGEQEKYELTWSDEFDIPGKIDSTKWNCEIGFLRNHEKQYYTANTSNVRVEGGNLIIEAKKNKVANIDFKTDKYDNKSWLKYISKIDSSTYTSASISTQGLAQWTYGKIVVRAILPKGVGLWPAIWMLGNNKHEVGWPSCGEIDIMEHVGYERDSIFGTIHTQAFNHMKGTQRGRKVFIENPYSQYHNYTIEWTPERIDFLLDGIVYNSFDNEHKSADEWPFDQSFFLKINLAIGGDLGEKEGIDDTVFPQRMLIDYVRIYQLKQVK